MPAVASPTIRATPGAVTFSRLQLDEVLERDYAEAVRVANANAQPEVVGPYPPTQERIEHLLKTHPIDIPKDEMEMDYMRAVARATNSQRDLERNAKGLGMTVEDFLDSEGLLTDTHLTPWAR